MGARFYVIDHEGFVSTTNNGGEPEVFDMIVRAEARALELAAISPGETIRIAKVVSTAKAKVDAATLTAV